MKKGIFVLAAVLSIACKNSSNLSQESSGSSSADSSNVSPLPSPQPEPPKPEEKMEKIKFGTDGVVTLNKETGEYNIDKLPTSDFDVNNLLSFHSLYDSMVSDPHYVYKSSLFPVDRYSLFQIPEVLNFDPLKSKDGQASDGKYDTNFQFWGALGKEGGRSYYACYKSVDHKYSKLDFIVNDDKNDKLNCSQLKILIDQGKVKPLNIKGGDYIMLRFYGFRAYSDGDCTNYSCKITYNSNIKYFTQIK